VVVTVDGFWCVKSFDEYVKTLMVIYTPCNWHVNKNHKGDEMSGSGGGTWVNEPTDDCATLAQFTTLNSPNQAVLKKLKKGDLLEISVRQAGKAVVVEAAYKGEVAGTITSSINQRLAECIDKGSNYVAEVREDVKGGACKVHVHAK
jgi:hypothetical protein